MSESNAAVKSVVEVYFPSRHMTLSYLNESFDLQEGDMVFVDGKLEGLRGEVVHVGQNFKVKLSDYKHVIAKADTNVSGEMFMEDKNLVAFDRAVIPYEKVLTWFKQPKAEDDDYILGNDDINACNFLQRERLYPCAGEPTRGKAHPLPRKKGGKNNDQGRHHRPGMRKDRNDEESRD